MAQQVIKNSLSPDNAAGSPPAPLSQYVRLDGVLFAWQMLETHFNSNDSGALRQDNGHLTPAQTSKEDI